MSCEKALQNHIEIEGLTYVRGERVIFDDISLQIPKGKVTAIMGPSGTGKTTLIKLIGGQLKPLCGAIRVDGKDVTRLKRKALFEIREKMGMLFQSGALFSDLSVFENVAFPLRAHTRLPEDMIADIVRLKLQAVGLRGTQHLMPAQLSGGMTRRVALARSIALDPEIVMYDEPFAGQDPIAMGMLVRLIRLLNDSLGITSVLVSHDVTESASISDHMIILSGGKVIAQGAPDELSMSESALVKQFMQGLPDGPIPFHYPALDYQEEMLNE